MRKSYKLLATAHYNLIVVLKLIIRKEEDVTHTDDFGMSVVHYAAQEGHTGYLEALWDYLDEDKSVIAELVHGVAILGNLTLLHLACRQHHERVAISLLRKGADPLSLITDNKTPFFFALQLGMTEVARMMIRRSKADPKLIDMKLETSPGKCATALHVDVDMAKMLLLEGANVLARDSDGKAPHEIITELKSKEAQAEFHKLLLKRCLK